MAEPHLSNLQALVSRLTGQIDEADAIECKHFFSGAAAYVDGRAFMTLTPVGLALKLPEHSRVLLLAEGARPLRYFPKAPIKKRYVVLPDRIVEDEDRLALLLNTSVGFALGQLKETRD